MDIPEESKNRIDIFFQYIKEIQLVETDGCVDKLSSNSAIGRFLRKKNVKEKTIKNSRTAEVQIIFNELDNLLFIICDDTIPEPDQRDQAWIDWYPNKSHLTTYIEARKNTNDLIFFVSRDFVEIRKNDKSIPLTEEERYIVKKMKTEFTRVKTMDFMGLL